ncbi:MULTISPECIES: sulfurtransferase TusA family protein [Sphingobium]|uniref:Redox protein n=1 Tax=Sphingobium yanoikuyae TaxID=13690 RepID=A0A291MUY2_SPHYA|nr:MULTISPECIES: sulfurtransferase TusA family protein [Sphingobium]ATI78740.1 redox protein [Sphingobium yanoikuyae]MBT2242311.1 sulfurtransferase TusA family protein [Sphingobium sp. BHU LFT2]QJR00935.1 sulfurtransferase TusA family protein [Sphingobium yanoikuyae]
MPNEAGGPEAAPFHVDARGMKCPWPVLRAARAMRDADHVTIDADDAIAPRELAALAQQHGWQFSALSPQRFALSKVPA